MQIYNISTTQYQLLRRRTPDEFILISIFAVIESFKINDNIWEFISNYLQNE